MSHLLCFCLHLSRREKPLFGKPLQLKTHLDKEKIAEIMFRKDMACTRQLSLSIDIRLAELRLIDSHTSLLISPPDHLTPMIASGIKSASVIENYPFYIFCIHHHILFIIIQ